MKKLFYLLILFLFSGIYVQAQSIYTNCDLADLNLIECNLEELDGFNGTMFEEDSPGIQPLPICPDGGAAHNIAWIGFVAQAGDYTISISLNDCSIDEPDLIPGAQLGIYTDCSFSNEIYCNSNCSTENVSISSSDLSPGDTYYLFIDGCFGTVCNFEISVEGVIDNTINIDTTICEGQDYIGLTETGTYTVETTDEDTGCDVIANVNLVVLPISDPACITSADELTKLDIKVYPNPAQNVFFIESDQPLDKISIFSVSSQKTEQAFLPKGQLKYTIPVDHLPGGLYIVSLEFQGQITYRKMVIE